MRILTTLSILLTMAIGSLAQDDLSTDDAVIKLYCNETGTNPEDAADWLCIERTDFENVIVLGTFASDAGCWVEQIIVDGELGDWKDMMGRALNAMEWADEQGRAECLISALDQLSMVFGDAMHETNNDFDHPDAEPYEAPRVEMDGKKYVLTYWYRTEPDMLPQNSYQKGQYTFNKKGELLEHMSIASFTVDMGWDDE